MTFIAMLRGINVGGKAPVKMDRLRELFEHLGFASVRTYVQSGNVVFRSKDTSATVLSKRLEAGVLKTFGAEVMVIVKTAQQLAKVLKSNPFVHEKYVDPSKLHVTFLADLPSKSGLKKLEALPAHSDQFRIAGEYVYIYCPNGYGRTKLSNNVIERVLEVGATTRNWNTVNNLYVMSTE